MSIPAELKYTDTHEWVRKEADGSVSVGITHHAQDLLGDLVYVENPQVGREVNKGEECGVVESVKAASDVYAPIAGTVAAVNEELADTPEQINSDPYGEGWIVKLQPSGDIDEGALMTPDAYQELLDEEDA